MRLISGVLKGKPLPSPSPSTRPTSDRARQMLFNTLHHSFFWESGWSSLRVLDVFAGTGALGFEALSRGASTVTFIEKDKTALEGLEKTITTLPPLLPKPVLLKQSA
ncbi:MAG: RsmD family RNA methyltransferase, partial [Holosporales bacterium]